MKTNRENRIWVVSVDDDSVGMGNWRKNQYYSREKQARRRLEMARERFPDCDVRLHQYLLVEEPVSQEVSE